MTMGLVMRTEFQRTQQEYRMKTFGLFACMAAVAAFAADPPTTTTLYKSIGPDGKTIYSDRPPGEGNSAKTLTFRNLPSSPLSASTLAYIEQLGKPKQAELAAAPAVGVVLYTTGWCGYCRQARAYLASKGVAYREIDIETKDGLMAYVQAGGKNGVPMLVAKGHFISGFSAGGYDALLAASR